MNARKRMLGPRAAVALSLFAILYVSPQLATAQTTGTSYFPAADWERRTPAEARINEALLKQAVEAAIAGETKAPRDLVMNHYQTFGREPFGYAIGPIRERGDPTGIVVQGGYIVVQWGDVNRVDMTHSVTKSMLSSVVGVAYDRGMIKSLDDPVKDYVGPVQVYNPLPAANKSDRIGSSDLIFPFEGPHNSQITWDHMLRQTSDWEGTLWGKPDWADRPGENPAQWITRPRNKPGTAYKYNDTRVNALTLATLNLWRRPLPASAEGEHPRSDRCVEHVALVRLRELVGDPGRQRRPVDDRGRALGRRHVHQRPGYGALRIPDAAARQMEGSPASVGAVDRAGAHAHRPGADLRVHELLSQHEPEAMAERAGERFCAYRKRHQPRLCRSGA